MKQSEIVNAYKTIENIEEKNKEYPLTVTYALYKVKRALQDQWSFQLAEEQQAMDKWRPAVLKDGRFQFEKPEDGEAFVKRLKELADMDVELDYIKPSIHINDDVGLTIREVEALNDFVNFIE